MAENTPQGSDSNKTYREKHFVPAVVLTFLYPFGKRPLARRLHIYPQYLLGGVLAWPAVPGWAAIHGGGQPFLATCGQCLHLCAVKFFWTLYFNTAYSYQDVVDDLKMGVHSFYNLLGGSPRSVQALLMALVVLVVACLAEFLYQFHSAWLWLSWMVVWTLSFMRQMWKYDAKKPETGGPLHRQNAGLGVWAVLVCLIELLIFR